MLHHINLLHIGRSLYRHVIGMQKRNKLLDIRLIRPDGCRASILSGERIEKCCQSLFKCDGVHVCSCLSHVSPTFSYSPKIDKSRTSVKSGSDNMIFFSLYGTASTGCQGGDEEGWFREAGLSVPLRKAVLIIGDDMWEDSENALFIGN